MCLGNSLPSFCPRSTDRDAGPDACVGTLLLRTSNDGIPHRAYVQRYPIPPAIMFLGKISRQNRWELAWHCPARTLWRITGKGSEIHRRTKLYFDVVPPGYFPSDMGWQNRTVPVTDRSPPAQLAIFDSTGVPSRSLGVSSMRRRDEGDFLHHQAETHPDHLRPSQETRPQEPSTTELRARICLASPVR